jgi:hypothetical protein
MFLDDIMQLSPAEFYGLYGRNAELYCELLRNDSALPVLGFGITKCTESLMAEPLWRYRMVYLSSLYKDGGYDSFGPGVTKPPFPQWPEYIDQSQLPDGYIPSEDDGLLILITESDNIIINE